MLLREMVEKNHVHFIEGAADWRDAIRQSCKPLEADGTVTGGYAEEIIACVERHGPYIAIMPGFALPHAMEHSVCVNGTAISFMKTDRAVSFDDSDPDKSATVFFTLASVDSERHMKNMRQLFKMLTDEDLCAELQQVSSVSDLLELADKYEKKEQ